VDEIKDLWKLLIFDSRPSRFVIIVVLRAFTIDNIPAWIDNNLSSWLFKDASKPLHQYENAFRGYHARASTRRQRRMPALSDDNI
jgi:hypothetical protein